MIGTESSLTRIWDDFINSTASMFEEILDRYSSSNLVTLEERQDTGTFIVRIHTHDGKNYSDAVRFLPNGSFEQKDIQKIAPQISGQKITLVLNPSRFLIREIPLPSQAETFVHNIIETQIDQLTPWTSDKALFGHTILRATSENITVALAATNKESLEPLVRSLESLKPRSLSLSVAPSSADNTPEIPLLKKDLGRIQFDLLRKILSAAVISLIGFAALFNIYSSWTVSSLNQEYESVQSRISAGRTLSTEPRTLNEVELQLLSRKLYSLPLTLVLEEISKVMPDNSSLTEFEYSGNSVRMVGISEDPSSLISQIEQSNILADAKFFSATTKGPDDKGGQFHIETQIKPEETQSP
ncbi:MAG: PilN domain-containing protein [Hyphomicrobium sp.]